MKAYAIVILFFVAAALSLRLNNRHAFMGDLDLPLGKDFPPQMW